MLVREVLSPGLRDRRALARFAGLTGTRRTRGARWRPKGIARAGHRRMRCGMTQLAWRLLQFQPDSELAQWYRRRVARAGGVGRKTFTAAWLGKP